jgi:S1-C subfamily serine protease
MKIALVLVASFLILAVSTNAQNVLTRKEIYNTNRDAVVQIYVGDNFSGTGFIVSADGTIVTANHVVATRDSHYREYAGQIMVLVFRKGIATPYPATPIAAQISADQVNYDFVKLKIEATALPFVKMGDWDEVDIDSEITVIPSFPGPGTLMLHGTVSSKGAFRNDLGPKPVNTILFQCPIHNGFSGAPIFSSKGNVIGIVDTKVFGISPALDGLKGRWSAGRGTVFLSGVDVAASFLELINNLDQNLVSGLGSGVAIDYAKKQQGAATHR